MPGYTPYVYPHPLVTGTGPLHRRPPEPLRQCLVRLLRRVLALRQQQRQRLLRQLLQHQHHHLLRLHHHRHLRQLQQRHLRLAQLRLTLTATATRTGCSVMPPRAKQRSGI